MEWIVHLTMIMTDRSHSAMIPVAEPSRTIQQLLNDNSLAWGMKWKATQKLNNQIIEVQMETPIDSLKFDTQSGKRVVVLSVQMRDETNAEMEDMYCNALSVAPKAAAIRMGTKIIENFGGIEMMKRILERIKRTNPSKAIEIEGWWTHFFRD
jgi:hypothetical protein